jgi:cyclic dehypoxanthinyl futalosine synthase
MSKKLIDNILEKALELKYISPDEGLLLYTDASLADLMFTAHIVRLKLHPEREVSYIIDRNINLTNVCFSNCSFCNFCRSKNSTEAYVLEITDYIEKIDKLYQLGGSQILLQGGMNPALRIEYYENLFRKLKELYPDLKLHALGPPEIVFIAKSAGISTRECLERLIKAGLDSLPGAGAEILVDRVRKLVSPAKCSSSEWLDVMQEAHLLGLTTSATMMFGHLETIEERLQHLIKLRDLQDLKPSDSKGYISFTLWPLAGENTRLLSRYPKIKPVNSSEFLRMLSISRIMLPNIPNIQVSWLTMGKEIAQLALNAGANDMSSIMIEENVVSQAGKEFKMGQEEMEQTIRDAGFTPRLRNQEYEFI